MDLLPQAHYNHLVSSISRSKAAEEILFRMAARSSIIKFAQAMYPWFIAGRHHHLICEQLERVECGDLTRLMIFAPPRHGKSMLVSVIFPAWYLSRHPEKKVITLSYNDDLASTFGRQVRNLVRSPEYIRIFGQSLLRQDSRAYDSWNTYADGEYHTAGVSGGFMGRGAHVALIDDPIRSREDADSRRYRERLWTTYESDIQSRLMPGGAVVLMHTRWSTDDLAGRLIESQGIKETLTLPLAG